MRVVFVSNKSKVNALIKRIGAMNCEAVVDEYDVPYHDLGKHVSFLRVHRVTAEVPSDIAYKVLEWAVSLEDGTWAMIESGGHLESMDTLLRNPDAVIEAKG